ncbi:YlaF family protein [Bacillus sp. z60-18]|uniref:YlaF family protein n=1 Tax=unclassified Bacillus (in: firmicutes) TaxID=185979 RepID=UPI00390C6B50
MKQIKWMFLLLALAAVISIMMVGVAIAEKSLLWVGLAFAILIVIMGTGFTLKKRMREKGVL